MTNKSKLDPLFNELYEDYVIKKLKMSVLTEKYKVSHGGLYRFLKKKGVARNKKESGALKIVNLIGQRFGKLIVLKFIETRKGHAAWECLCDCDTLCIINGDLLRSGKTTSCGCKIHEPHLKHKDREFALWHLLYCNTIKRRNKSKFDKEPSLSLNEFIELSQQDCFYCGNKPNNIRKDKTSDTKIMFNGIDRIDNNIEYTKENSVACCPQCNFSKYTMQLNEYIKHIEQTYKNLKKKNLLE